MTSETLELYVKLNPISLGGEKKENENISALLPCRCRRSSNRCWFGGVCRSKHSQDEYIILFFEIILSK